MNELYGQGDAGSNVQANLNTGALISTVGMATGVGAVGASVVRSVSRSIDGEVDNALDINLERAGGSGDINNISQDLELTYKNNWTEEQRRIADIKVQQLTESQTTVTHNIGRTGRPQSEYRRNNEMPTNTDADHIKDLQLGGKDVNENIQTLDSSVNRSVGSQIQQRIKDLPEGTIIDEVRIDD
jgi:hypothetical protein